MESLLVKRMETETHVYLSEEARTKHIEKMEADGWYAGGSVRADMSHFGREDLKYQYACTFSKEEYHEISEEFMPKLNSFSGRNPSKEMTDLGSWGAIIDRNEPHFEVGQKLFCVMDLLVGEHKRLVKDYEYLIINVSPGKGIVLYGEQGKPVPMSLDSSHKFYVGRYFKEILTEDGSIAHYLLLTLQRGDETFTVVDAHPEVNTPLRKCLISVPANLKKYISADGMISEQDVGKMADNIKFIKGDEKLYGFYHHKVFGKPPKRI